MSPHEFIAKWRGNTLTERAGAQAFFIDLCDLLGVDKPNDPENYCFERGASRTGAGVNAKSGWADVWKRGCFAWESKAPGRDLGAALKQLMTYALALDNPPLLVVSDREIIQIHTHFTGTPSEVHTIALADIGQPENLQKLGWLFTAPDNFKPRRSSFAVTEEAATRMGGIAKRLTERGNDALDVAHFLIQCVFCMFAEDTRLLPEKLFETVLDRSNPDGVKAQSRLNALFQAMQSGGDFALNEIPWFNGGLFKRIDTPALETADVVELLAAARMDWRAIEPAILGTLFERGLNPDMRSQLGAHYTDPATILKLIRPVIEHPLLAEWQTTKAAIAAAKKHRDKEAAFIGYLERLKAYRVLDPACGSGNFLYLALKTLKDLEHRANLEAETLGLHRQIGIEVSPANVLGIELNPYAAELARITVWIGEIQWMLDHGYAIRRDPILSNLDHIECRDAVLTFSPPPQAREGPGEREIHEPAWPAADAIVGNPPFLGDKKMRAELGDKYTLALRREYDGRVPGGADLVTYWFEKARAQIEAGKAQRAGLVATNSIRGGASRKVLERIIASAPIFAAWSDEEWVNNGAAVRVSLVCFGRLQAETAVGRMSVALSAGCEHTHTADNGLTASSALRTAMLDGQPVAAIHADLTAGALTGAVDLTLAKRLAENAGVSFMGVTKSGPFDIPGELARGWLGLPNPHNRSNRDVLYPSANGQDLAKRASGDWVIHFGERSESEAALYEAPYQYALEHIKPTRLASKTPKNREVWWRFERSRPEMLDAFGDQQRYIATSKIAKHRIFTWLPRIFLPLNTVIVVARADDTTFGILQSRLHEVWTLSQSAYCGVGNDPTYTPTTTFETFPFPEGLTPRDTAPAGATAEAIAVAARRLNELRENWLNPPEWVDWVRTPEEEQAGFPARPVAKSGHEAELKKRTLTNLYNARPAWLTHAHRELDAAVAAAYGWTDYAPNMPDAEILRRLLALNQARTRTAG